jgi:hypothetical protein
MEDTPAGGKDETMADDLDQLARRYRALAARLGDLGFISPGSLVRRYTYCGKPGCRCQASPPRPHGPYYQLTRKIAGKTTTRRLTSDQAARYAEWDPGFPSNRGDFGCGDHDQGGLVLVRPRPAGAGSGLPAFPGPRGRRGPRGQGRARRAVARSAMRSTLGAGAAAPYP